MFETKMRFILGIIIVLCAGCISLASSAGNCTHLDANLFGRCISTGIDRSSASDPDKLAGLLNKTVAKFQLCSPALVDIMACSIYVPKCSEGRSEPMLPCPEVCNKFVSDCAHQDGVDVVRKLCLLLPAKNKNASCLKPEGFKNNSTVAEPSSETCKPLSVEQCDGLGYNLTTLSTDSQLRLRESDIMKKIENASIPVKRLACTELAPPCFPDDKDKLLTACKGSCLEASQNHIKQFIDIFGTDPEYCTGQPEKAANSRGQFCPRHTWPKSGLWHEGLRWALGLQVLLTESSNGDNTTAPTTDSSIQLTSEPPTTPSILTTAPPEASSASPGNTTTAPITKPNTGTTSEATTGKTKSNDSTTAPEATTGMTTSNLTSSTPTTNAGSAIPSKAPVTNVSTAAPITKSNESTTPATTTAKARNSTSPPPTTNAASKSPSTAANVSTAAPITRSNDSTTPATTTAKARNSTSPPPTTNAASKSPSTAAKVSTAAPITKSNSSTTPAITTAKARNSTSPPPTTNASKRSSKERSTERGASTKPVIKTRFTTTRPTSTGKSDVHARKKPQKKTMSGGAIAGAAIGAICGLVLIIALAVFLIRRRRNSMQYAHRVMVDMEDL